MAVLEVVSVFDGRLLIWLDYDPATLVVSDVAWSNTLPSPATVTIKGRSQTLAPGNGSTPIQGKPTHVVPVFDDDGTTLLGYKPDFTVSAKVSVG